MSRRSTIAVLAAFALVAMFLVGNVAHADVAPPPIGSWVGKFSDGSAIQLVLQPNGDCIYGVVGYRPTMVGKASWNPSYSGGILTVEYYNAQFLSHAYYSITWINDNAIQLSDPYFKIVMRRQ